jgi:RNA polymerase sigma factor (sigma-70 family)
MSGTSESSISEAGDSAEKAAWFTTTHWSLILRARDPSSTEAAEALEKLCQTYWYPLYAFVRREGKDEETAKDLTQAFFLRLFERKDFEGVQREKGKFRSFLLKSMQHFLADEWDKAKALKRGGDKTVVSLDDKDAEARYRLEPVESMSPDKLYDRRWALTVLNEATKRAREEYHASGRGEIYEHLRRHLSGGPDTPACAETARRLETTENTVKSWIHRLRQRNRELVREVIAETVSAPQQIDEELRDLFEALTGN